jgi:hypothetical protein
MSRVEFTPVMGSRLEQYRTLEYILLGDLRDLLEEPANRYTRRWLAAVLDALLDTLPREMAIKEADGYLDVVLEEYPSWYRQVEELQNEQQLLFLALQSLRDRLESRQPYDRHASEARSQLREWMKRLTAHHRHENRIVQTAMNLEVGCGD